jgi:hypothetical protein
MQAVEDNFAALKSCFSGTSAPSNPAAGMAWLDTTNHIIKVRNEANSAWIPTWDVSSGTEAALSLTDNTTNDVSTTKHGFVPKAPNDTSKYFRGDGTWATIPNTVPDYSAGNVLVGSSSKESSSSSSSYVLAKEITISRGGQLRIKFAIKSNSAAYTYGRIYRNGSAVGTERTQTAGTTYTEYSEDISGWSAGDKVQLYIKQQGSATVTAKDFRLYSDAYGHEPVTDFEL